MSSTETAENRLQIELLKKDVTSIISLFRNMEDSVDKIDSAAEELTRLLMKQEQRIEREEEVVRAHKQKYEEYINNAHERFVTLNAKIETVEAKLEKIHLEILHKIEELHDKNTKNIATGSSTLQTQVDHINKTLSEKIVAIDTWRYMVMGGIAFAVFVFSNITGITTVITKLFR